MTDELIRKTEEYIREQGLLAQGDVIIAGVSGGVDSICLLVILDELSAEWDWTLRAVHVNHGIRGESADADEAFVEKFCRERGIPCVTHRANVPALARERGQGIEECARDVRREIFEREAKSAVHDAARHSSGASGKETEEGVKKTKKADKAAVRIATAHHMGDDVETFIFNLCRGSSLKGLSGIRPATGRYVRPLLFAERGQIEAFADRNGISYRVDETNYDTGYTRNLIRHEVMPLLSERINEASARHIRQAIEQIRLASDLIERQADDLYTRVVVKEGKTRMIPAAVGEYEDILISELIHRCVREMAGQSKDITLAHVTAAAGLFDKQVGRSVDLPYGLICRRVYGGIEFSKRDEQKSWAGLDQYEFSSRFPDEGEELDLKGNPYTKYFDYDIIGTASAFRTRQSGDYIVTDQNGGRTKLQDWFVDHKIPQEIRDDIPLLADGHHVYWIVGYRQSSDSFLSAQTKHVIEWRARLRHGL